MRYWFFLLVLVSTIGYSQNWEVHVPVLSHHFSAKTYLKSTANDICTGGYCIDAYPMNNINPGIIVFKYFNKFKIGGGLYKNSTERTSIIIGGGYELINNIGIEAGLATNYEPREFQGKSLFVPLYGLYFKQHIFKIMINHEIVNLGISLNF